MVMTRPTPRPGVDWDAARRRLLVGYGAAGDHPRQEEVSVPARVVLDGQGGAVDVDIMALPDRVADALARYAVSVRRSPQDGIALDTDAGWLWLHLADGVPAEQLRGTAHVRITLDGSRIAEVELTLSPTAEAEPAPPPTTGTGPIPRPATGAGPLSRPPGAGPAPDPTTAPMPGDRR
ncbi:hypothetical protein D1794_19775 [Streptomyces clavuligerus]|nr:hypothetical protein D1794_19775 [Streptomyces clavuligerus]